MDVYGGKYLEQTIFFGGKVSFSASFRRVDGKECRTATRLSEKKIAGNNRLLVRLFGGDSTAAN